MAGVSSWWKIGNRKIESISVWFSRHVTTESIFWYFWSINIILRESKWKFFQRKKPITSTCTSVDNLIEQMKPLLRVKFLVENRDLSVLTKFLRNFMFSKIQTLEGGPKTFIKQSLPKKQVWSFDWGIQPGRLGIIHVWKPSCVSLYSILGSFRLWRFQQKRHYQTQFSRIDF